MEEAFSPVFEFPFQEAVAIVPSEHNTFVIRLQNHTWVSLSDERQQIANIKTFDSAINLSVSPGTYTIRSDGTIESATSEFSQPIPSLFDRLSQFFLLHLSSDAPDQHIVDGVGEIPADGSSFCTITIEKTSQMGEPLTGEENQDELFLRTTGGVLMDAEGQNRIRSLNLKAGRATLRLVSEASPKVVTVSVFGKDPLMSKAEIQIEFV